MDIVLPTSMPRSGGIRRYCRKIAKTPKREQIAYIPPFVILTAELILLFHALELQEAFVIFLTSFLLIVSLIELFIILREMHQHRCQSTFERELTIRSDDFIIERHMDNVSRIVEDFLNEYEEYKGNRSTIYHIACQIMQTHKQELWEKTLRIRLTRYLKKTKKESMRDIINDFLRKFPEYRKDPEKVYQIIASYLKKISNKK